MPGNTLLSHAYERLYQTSKETSDSNGNVTLDLGCVPVGLTWTGSLFCVSIQPANILAATWLALVANVPFGIWYGAGSLWGLQAFPGEEVTVQGYSVAPNVQVQVSMIGRADDSGSAPIIWPKSYSG